MRQLRLKSEVSSHLGWPRGILGSTVVPDPKQDRSEILLHPSAKKTASVVRGSATVNVSPAAKLARFTRLHEIQELLYRTKELRRSGERVSFDAPYQRKHRSTELY